MNIAIEYHPWKPYIPSGACVFILGSFPPDCSRWAMEFYYPNWINDFWRIMGLLFYDDKDWFCESASKTFKLHDIMNFLQTRKIAVGDMAVGVRRLKGNASDKFLDIVSQLSVPTLVSQMPECRAVVATGEKASQVLSEQFNVAVPSVGSSVDASIDGRKVKLYRMPSSSRAYPLSLSKKAEFYRNMFVEMGML